MTDETASAATAAPAEQCPCNTSTTTSTTTTTTTTTTTAAAAAVPDPQPEPDPVPQRERPRLRSAANRKAMSESDEISLDIILPLSRGIPTAVPLSTVSTTTTTAATTTNTVTTTTTGTEQQWSYFDALPDEVLVRIHSHLDVPSLGRMAQTCRRMHSLSNDVPMWKELSKRQNWLQGASGATRSFFVRRFVSFRNSENRRIDEERNQEVERRHRRRRDRTLYGLLWTVLGRHCEWLAGCLLVLFHIFCLLRWDRKIDWSWGVIFVPVYLVVVQALLAPALYLAARCSFEDDFDNDLEPRRCCRPFVFNLLFVLPLHLRKHNTPQYFVHLLLLCAWLLLLAAKSSGNAISWWAVMIPLMVFFFHLLSITPLTVGDGLLRGEKPFDRVSVVPTGIMITVFLGFLAAQLEENIYWSYHWVMFPLYLLDLYLLVAPIVIFLCSVFCLENCMYRTSRWGHNPGTLCFSSLLGLVVLVAPATLFEALLAETLDGSKDYRISSVFIPLYVVEGLAVAVVTYFNIYFTCDH